MIGLNDNGEWTELTKEEIAARQAKAAKMVDKAIEKTNERLKTVPVITKSTHTLLAELSAKLGN
ncbi:MAG: hypothetical protein JZU53_04690 [Paludibacter sp.]|nr:hypothetical protein [Paludibacter sp.]